MLPATFLRPFEVLEMDIQDMKVVSEAGNRYLLVVVDRATKFLLAYPLPSKGSLGVSQKLLELLLLFGLPLSIRCDAGGEFTAEVIQHLLRWLKVSLDIGPSNHPRAQGAVERLGGWLQGTLSELCVSWPTRWDAYVPVATWIYRLTPDATLPGHATPYRMFFGREPRTPLDELVPTLDSQPFAPGLERSVAESAQMAREVRSALAKRHEGRNRARQVANEGNLRQSPGTKAKVGDKVLVKESASTLHRDGVHPKLAHEHFTGPWEVVNVTQRGLIFTVRLNGRQVRQRNIAPSDIKPYHRRPLELRHAFSEEFASTAWSADLGLAAASVAAVPLFTLIDRRVAQGVGRRLPRNVGGLPWPGSRPQTPRSSHARATRAGVPGGSASGIPHRHRCRP